MFKPLVDEIPGFGAVVYSLKEIVSTTHIVSTDLEGSAYFATLFTYSNL